MSLPAVNQQRDHVRNVRDIVDNAYVAAERGEYWQADSLRADAWRYLAEFVEQMGHASANTAKRLAAECLRLP